MTIIYCIIYIYILLLKNGIEKLIFYKNENSLYEITSRKTIEYEYNFFFIFENKISILRCCYFI
jgi:hypothetical protein